MLSYWSRWRCCAVASNVKFIMLDLGCGPWQSGICRLYAWTMRGWEWKCKCMLNKSADSSRFTDTYSWCVVGKWFAFSAVIFFLNSFKMQIFHFLDCCRSYRGCLGLLSTRCTSSAPPNAIGCSDLFSVLTFLLLRACLALKIFLFPV